VQDVSELVALQSRQAEDRRRSSREFATLIKAFDAEPGALREFVSQAETGLMEINGLLRSAVGARNESGILKAADLSSRNLQALKAHAETLALDSLAAYMQRLDTDLSRLHQLQGSPKLLVDALPRLQVALEDLLSKINPLKGLAELRRSGATEGGSSASINAELTQLAQVVAYDSGKSVQVHARVGALNDMAPGPGSLVREILLQLLRNAVVHGIETPTDRQTAGKSGEGRIDLTLDRAGNDWTLSVRDNGAGVATSQIRQRLLALGWYTDAQLEAFTERQLLGQMFKPGYSSTGQVADGTQAVGGLEMVVAHAQKLGGQFRLNSSKNEFTEFLIRFQA
jgi:chemotaxis protein histidine kinase CheA